MDCKRLLIALLVMVLTISPALAAHCSSACGNHGMKASAEMAMMQDMPNCHHADTQAPQQDASPAHDHCSMAGCHAISMAFFHPQASYLSDLQGAHPLQRDFPGRSADLSPPIKPPA